MDFSNYVTEFTEYQIHCANCSNRTQAYGTSEDAENEAESEGFQIIDDECLCAGCAEEAA